MISNNVSEPKLFDLNLVQFSERNLKNEIDKQQINNILEKIFKQSNEKTKDVSFLDKEDNHKKIQQMKTSNKNTSKLTWLINANIHTHSHTHT